MASNYIHNTQLPIIDKLYQKQNSLLTQLAGSLKVEDVKEDSSFEATVSRIKSQILFTPVEFGEPKISDHYPSTRQVPPNYQNLMGGTQNINNITVDFPFTGSTELFGVMPNNVMHTSGRVYQPHGNSISIEVILTQLDKEKALSEARGTMEATKSLVEANNKQATDWSNSMDSKIDSMLQQKRKEILDFYS
jgi:hypothetical protein